MVDKLNVTVFTTKTSLKSLAEAANNISEQLGTQIKLKIFYRGDWDAYSVKFEEFSNAILSSDVILLDIRSGVPETIVDLVERSKARVVVPLVPATATVVSLMRLGKFSRRSLAERIRKSIEESGEGRMGKVFRAIDAIEKIGSAIPIGSLKHYRNWILLTKYWAYWGRNNLENMLRLILAEYFGFNVKYEKPKEVGELSFWDPKKGFYQDLEFVDFIVVEPYQINFTQNQKIFKRVSKTLEMTEIDLILVTNRPIIKSWLDTVKRTLKNIGECRFNVKLYTTKELNPEVKDDFRKADIIILDTMADAPEILADLIDSSGARVVVSVTPGTAKAFSFIKLGEFTGEKLAKRVEDVLKKGETADMSKMFKMTDFIEKIGSYLPIGSLKHYRNWILITKYWAYWGEQNLENMFRLILSEYFGIKMKYDKPKRVGEFSFWDHKIGFYEWPELRRPTAVIFMYPGMHFDQNAPIAVKLKEYLENRGVNVVCMTGGVMKGLLKQVEMFEKIDADAVINLQWFLINGGPYGGPLEPTRSIFLKKGFLLFNGLVMYMNRVSRWIEDEKGLLPIETIAGVVLPEMDGAIEPIPSAGLDDSELSEIVVIEDRVKKKAERVANWIDLKYKRPEDRKIAIVIYNYPPGEHNVGDASYLDTLKSLEVLLKALKESGYKTEVLTKEQLKEKLPFLANSPSWVGQDGIRFGAEKYAEYFAKLKEKNKKDVIRSWGEPPGNINVVDGEFVIPGIVLGNVFIGVQPSRGGYERILDSKVYHSKDLPPHHQYLAFYYWIREVFGADVVIHLGTHGTLEFMPGKEVGLSDECWPDILIGEVPHVYVYHVTNPSEMAIAKRRGYAYVITHGTPAFVDAGLYGEYAEIERLLDEYYEADGESKTRIAEVIKEKCSKLNLEFEDFGELREYVYEMKRSAIPKGLHVLGEVWDDEEILNYILFVLRKDLEVKSLHRIIAESKGIDYDNIDEKTFEVIEKEAKEILAEVLAKRDLGKYKDEELKRTLSYALDLAERIKRSDEISGILKALSGRYVEPRIAGDPIRTPEVFPTGTHGYTFDARLVPSEAAMIRGAKIAEETIKAYYEKHGKYPETVGVVLWGFETAQTRGETIGQILHYLGVRIVRKEGPWAPELEVIPLEELGRPRIDVLVTICGIFRDIFPNLVELIDRAFRKVAELDERSEENYVKKHLGDGKKPYRIFGPKPGAYNTRLTDIIETSEWLSEEELAKFYIEDMMYAYGENVHGEEAAENFIDNLKNVEMVCQIRSSAEYEITDLDHYYEFFGGLKRAVEDLVGRKVDAHWVDSLENKIKIRSSEDAIDFATRTRILNPTWIESMLEHGYDGVREISKRIEYLLGHSALTGVSEWVWDKVCDTYILNEELRKRMEKENPWAVYEIAKRLYEAYRRGYWSADREKIEKIRDVAGKIESELEEMTE